MVAFYVRYAAKMVVFSCVSAIIDKGYGQGPPQGRDAAGAGMERLGNIERHT